MDACRGYMAPEYAAFGQLSEKADVFSFGVLCLEIAAGRKNIKNDAPPDEQYLSSWVSFFALATPYRYFLQ
jgi:hypothetical protein